MTNDEASRSHKPRIIVLGGPNGAGKTTSALSLLPAELRLGQFVNADMIARGLSPLEPRGTEIHAGRLMLGRIRDLAQRSRSFAFETTLASRTFAPFLTAQRKRGFLIHVIYVWLHSVEIVVARVRARVQAGGHDIPEADIRRRYERGLSNFLHLYAPLADTWTLCDNSGAALLQVAEGGVGRGATVHAPAVYARIQGSVASWPLRNRRVSRE